MAEVPLDRVLHSWTKQTSNLITGKEYSLERLHKIVNCPSLYSEASKGIIYKGDEIIELNAKKAQNVIARDLMECMKHTIASDDLGPPQKDDLVPVLYTLCSDLVQRMVSSKSGLNEYVYGCYSSIRKMRENYYDIIDTSTGDVSAETFEILKAL